MVAVSLNATLSISMLVELQAVKGGCSMILS